MQCVLLAAGEGVRMRPLTLERPKPLVEVAGRPILAHILDMLPSEVDELVLVVKFRQQQIRDFVGTSYNGVPVVYVEQGDQYGTGGAVLAAREVLHGRFIILTADDLHGKEALETLAHEDLAVMGTYSDTPELFGVLAMTDEGFLKEIEEKPVHPSSQYISTSTMVLDERVFAHATPAVGGEVRLTDMVTLLAEEASVQVVEQPEWCPVGCPEDIAVAEDFLRKQM